MLRAPAEYAADVFREFGLVMTNLICQGCGADIDDSITRHEWTDLDDGSLVNYHVDCCPGMHVTQGDCGEVDA